MKQTIEWTCDYCGKGFFRSHYQFAGEITNVFCDQKCSHLFQIKKVKCACGYCGKEFQCTPQRLKQNKNVFCSRECFGHFKTNKIKSSCDNCGTDIYRRPCELKENMFCSKPCADIFKRKKIKCICANCGKESWRKPGKVKENAQNGWRFFCNRSCKQKAANGSVRYRGPNWKDQRAKALFRDGYMCCICGKTDRIQVHHIIPFKEFNYSHKENDNYLSANRLDNLITLCSSHHRKAEFGKISIWALQLAQFPPMA